MSRLVVVNASEQIFIEAYLAVGALGGGFSLRLFTNDVTAGLTPAEIDELAVGDFTQATFAGYAAIGFTNTGWTFTQGNPTTAVNTPRTFTRTSTGAAQLIQGYHVTRVTDGGLAWFEQFDAPISIEFTDDAITITPTLTLDDTEGNAVETGSMMMWAADATADVPSGWLLCDGDAVSRTTFASLFATIGETFGIGDGATTFNLPDMRQRFPLGQAASGTGVNVGDTGGAIDHVHGLDTATSGARIGMAVGSPGTTPQQRKTIASYARTQQGSITVSTNTDASTIGVALTGDTNTENPPFTTLNFIIKT